MPAVGWKPKSRRGKWGAGQESADQRWDMYEARDKEGAMGAGGQGGMGAGGVYVKSPDGSMHWDESVADPNPNGGSVVTQASANNFKAAQSSHPGQDNTGTLQVVQGANSQSGPTGPGGTGPPGSQARQAHITELAANPGLVSGTSGTLGLWSGSAPSAAASPYGTAYGTNPAWTGGPTAGSQMDASMMATSPGLATLSAAGYTPPTVGDTTNKSTTPHAVAGELDPTTFKTYGVSSNWPAFGGGQESGGMGAGAIQTANPNQSVSGVIDPYDLGTLINNAAQIQVQNQQEIDTNQTNLLTLAQNWSIHQDDLAYQQGVQAEVVRHNQATEEITRQQQQIDLQINQLDNQTRVQVQQMVNQSAQQIEGMREANQIQQAQMQEGTQIYMQQGDQAFKDWQARQQNAMSILGSALSNPWLQQLSGMAPPGGAGSPVGGSNIQALVQQILTPYNVNQFGVQNAPAAAGLPGGAQGTPQMQQTNLTSPGGAQFTPTSGGQGAAGTPSWQDWQSWSPFQKAAYRTNVEAAGPGAWNQQQSTLQDTFASQGGSPDITQMASAAASPLEAVGQQMTAGAFGQTPQQWQTQQARQWSQSAAPTVKQNLGVSQGGASSSQATPESQFGI